MFGIHDQTHPVKHYDIETDSTSVKLEPVREKFLHVPLPWRKKAWDLKNEGMRWAWLRVGIWWYRHPNNYKTWYVRFGVFYG